MKVFGEITHVGSELVLEPSVLSCRCSPVLHRTVRLRSSPQALSISDREMIDGEESWCVGLCIVGGVGIEVRSRRVSLSRFMESVIWI